MLWISYFQPSDAALVMENTDSVIKNLITDSKLIAEIYDGDFINILLKNNVYRSTILR